jgi:molybdate transport system substrate-binding protein
VRRAVASAACLAVLACGPDGSARGNDATVLAASSLSEAFGELARVYERSHPGSRVLLELAASPTLAAQVRAGARFDVLATADERTMAEVWRAGLVERPVALATNRLVVVVPSDDPGGIRGVDDLARPGVRVILARRDVPAGAYAREALAALGIESVVESKVVLNTPDVKAVAAAVALGEADAGIVYATDVTRELRGRVRVFPLPERISVRATYPIALATEPEHPVGGRAFLDLARSAAGREILAAHGFGPP